MATAPKNSRVRYYRIHRREIAFFKYAFEAYEGLALVTTVDARKGVVLLRIAPGCEAEVDAAINDLRNEIMIEHLAP